MYPMRLVDGLYQSVVYNFYFWGCVEVLGGYHEVTYTFTFFYLNPYVPKELIIGPSPIAHYCFWIYLG